MVGDGFEVGAVGRRGGFCGELLGEFGVLFAEGVEARVEGGHAFLEAAAVEVVAFEGVVVAVEGALAAADFLGEPAPAFLQGGSPGLFLGGGFVEGFADERSVAEKRGELLEDGAFELVAGDALAVAACTAELLPTGAGVVVVGAAVSAGGHADVCTAAAAAADEAREQVVARVAPPKRHVLASLSEQPARTLEGDVVDEWFVEAGQALAAPDHPAQVGLVVEDELHNGRLPAGGRRRRLLGSERARDRSRTEPAPRVQVEDPLHDRGCPLVADHVFVLVAAVAERQAAGGPAALFGTPFDAGGDAVDDGGVLELGEHGQHLQHHPARRRAGVERLRGRAERDSVGVELLGDLGELTHLPAQPVDAIDEQQVDRA